MSAHDAPSPPLPGMSWQRSTRSVGMNNCVETARCADGALAVRDSKDPGPRYLVFSPGAWTGFVRALEARPR